MDGLWIVILYLLVTFQIGSHTMVNRIMWGFGSGVLVVSLILLWVLFHRQHAHHFVNNTSWAARFIHFSRRFTVWVTGANWVCPWP